MICLSSISTRKRGQMIMERTFIQSIGIENVMNLYISNRKIVFGIVVFACAAISIVSIRIVKNELNEILANFLKNFIYIVSIALFGNLIYYVGLEVKFKSSYMPMLVGVLMGLFLLAIYAVEFLRYHVKDSAENQRINRLKIANRMCQVFYYFVFAEVLLLSITNHLEMIEAVVCSFMVIALKYLERILDFEIEKMFQDESNPQKLDIPVKHREDLFGERRKQLLTVCKELEEIEKSPFAIMISGEWGSGKSSFLNAMKEQMDNVEFIIIEGGMEIDMKNILNDIAIQIEKVFEKNKFYIGRNSSVEKYFEYIGNMAEGVGYSFAADILKGLRKGSADGYEQNKDAINKELLKFYEVVNKKIFIVIDNLDRVKDEVRDKMFDVIRESINLNCCTTVFLVDQEKIRTNHISKEFIEKYINRHIELCPISYEVIYAEYYEEFSDLKFESDYINQKKEEIMEYMLDEIESIIEACEEEREERRKTRGTYNSDEDKKYVQEQIKSWTDVINRQKKGIQNPRKFKRFLFDHLGVMLAVVDSVWFSDEMFEANLYSKLDWGKIIFRIAYLKSFLYEEYDALLYSGSLKNFSRRTKEYRVVKVILGIERDRYLNDKLDVIELLVYHLYSLDSRLDRSKIQSLLDELNYNRLQEKNLQRYFEECIYLDKKNEYLKKMIDYTLVHRFEDASIERNVVFAVAGRLASLGIRERENVEDIISTMMNIVENKEIYFSRGDIQKLKSYQVEFRKQSITELKTIISTVLQVMFQVDSEWTEIQQGITNLEGLYHWIRGFYMRYLIEQQEKSGRRLEVDWGVDAISCMRNYFIQMREWLSDKAYAYIREEMQEYFDIIDSTIREIDLWDMKVNKETSLDPEQAFIRLEDDGHGNYVIKKELNDDNILENMRYLAEEIERSDEKKAEHFMDLVNWVKINSQTNNISKEKLKEVVSLFKIMFQILDKDKNIRESYGERWVHCKLNIFMLEREASISYQSSR